MASKDNRVRPGAKDRGPSLRRVSSADYESTPPRMIDPAPLTRLLAAWSGTGTEEAAAQTARELAEDDRDGPIHLVRVLAALDVAARRTGGSLAHLTDTPAVTAICGGTLHHLVEVLHSGGLQAATTAARDLDAQARFLALTALRPHWQAPLHALTAPLHDAQVMPRKRPWGF
ncbi:hypothetical protein ACWGJ2_20370 [Streptomyces sp. NPDC054796]